MKMVGLRVWEILGICAHMDHSMIHCGLNFGSSSLVETASWNVETLKVISALGELMTHILIGFRFSSYLGKYLKVVRILFHYPSFSFRPQKGMYWNGGEEKVEELEWLCKSNNYLSQPVNTFIVGTAGSVSWVKCTKTVSAKSLTPRALHTTSRKRKALG